jgi:hypothetical protein
MSGEAKAMNYLSKLCILILIPPWTIGCGGPYKEPTIDKFDGKITHKGQPVTFSSDDKVVLRLVFHKNGERFGIPINPDGTFDIGWMPIGNYSAILERSSNKQAGVRSGVVESFNIEKGLTIAEGKTQYAVELGDDFRP